jgi:hypothetical protein
VVANNATTTSRWIIIIISRCIANNRNALKITLHWWQNNNYWQQTYITYLITMIHHTTRDDDDELDNDNFQHRCCCCRRRHFILSSSWWWILVEWSIYFIRLFMQMLQLKFNPRMYLVMNHPYVSFNGIVKPIHPLLCTSEKQKYAWSAEFKGRTDSNHPVVLFILFSFGFWVMSITWVIV